MYEAIDSCTVSVAIVRATLEAAQTLGLSADELRAAFDPEGIDLNDANGRMPLRCLIELDRAIERRRCATAESMDAPLRARIDNIADAVRHEIAKLIRDGHAGNIKLVARSLAVSSRTLQRRLESEGTTFGSLLDEVRRGVALDSLKNANVPIKEAVFLAGFSEPSAFYRAFRRWTGSTPADYRCSLA